MRFIIKYKIWYFAFSLLVIIPGIISLLLWKLDLSIDFTGGSVIAYDFQQPLDSKTYVDVRNSFAEAKMPIYNLTQTAPNELTVQTIPLNNIQNNLVMGKLLSQFGPYIKQGSFESVGPIIGSEITTNAFKAIVAAAILIVLYIALSFRKVPRPASSWKFGICAIVALIHDVLVLVGLFSLFGHFFQIQIDSLFVTAVLTVIGFSVHDTIVVFDRIRENLIKGGSGQNFATVVNDSIVQTLSRSVNTSLTAILVLATLLFFGGESIKWFVVALLIGIISGTYSSIFNAAPLLVLWQEWDDKKRTNKKVLQ